MNILVVGGGVAGLTCARILDHAGHTVMLLEASDDIGGRVRSDKVDGYTLDRGFQVLFENYPAAQRQLNLDALQLRCFDPGAIICVDGQRKVLTDPRRDHNVGAVAAAALTSAVTPLDKLRTLLLSRQLAQQTIDEVLAGPDMSTWKYLIKQGFSQRAITNFFQPFYGGIFLDRSLETSAKCFKFTFKMLSTGAACLPTQGMGSISQQLAQSLVAHGCVKLNTPVQTLLTSDGRVVGARLADGTDLSADAVVLAVAAPDAARLCQNLPKPLTASLPSESLQTITLYFSGSRPFYHSRKILLNAAADALVNNAQLLTNIAPEYAPPGRHLLSATILGQPALPDDELYARALADLRLMFCGDAAALDALTTYTPLRVYRIAYAQFAQPPGIHVHLPDNDSGVPGLYFAAEFTEASSINAAMISGEKCATLLLNRKGQHSSNR